MIEIEITSQKRTKLKRLERISINSQIIEDQNIKRIVEKYSVNIDKQLDKILGYINAPLEGRTDIIRKQESNLGNFLCDIMLNNTNADCALLNSGAMRSDCVHPPGEFKARDLRNILSFESEIIVLYVTGRELHEVLEHGVAKYESGGGRYPQVAGIFFAFDPSKPPNNRIDSRIVKVQGEYLDLDKVKRFFLNFLINSLKKKNDF